MTKRARIAAFGSAGLLVLSGAACGALIAGPTGQILALVLVGLGLVATTSLVFLEIGLSEDRDRAEELERSVRKRNGRRRLKRVKLERSRGHRRSL